MSKHKGKGRKHGRGMRGLAGLGNMSSAGALGRDVLPGVIGIAVTLGGAVALRSFVQPSPGTMATVYRFAPVIGAGAGLLAAGGVYAATAKRSGKGPAMAVASTSILTGALAYGMERLVTSSPGAMSAVAAIDTSSIPAAGPAAMAPTQGMGALVAEIRPPGTKGVLMETPMRGSYGESVAAPIRGAIDASAFGRPQSRVNG